MNKPYCSLVVHPDPSLVVHPDWIRVDHQRKCEVLSGRCEGARRYEGVRWDVMCDVRVFEGVV